MNVRSVRKTMLAMLTLAMLSGCSAPAGVSPEAGGHLENTGVKETSVVFEGEIQFLASTKSPFGGTPCGGITVGSADNTAHEWELPTGTHHVDLRLEAEPTTASLRLCLIEGSDEYVAHGVPPLSLSRDVQTAQVTIVVQSDDEPALPQTPAKVKVMATAVSYLGH